jgi:hypothetical protein
MVLALISSSEDLLADGITKAGSHGETEARERRGARDALL